MFLASFTEMEGLASLFLFVLKNPLQYVACYFIYLCFVIDLFFNVAFLFELPFFIEFTDYFFNFISFLCFIY